MLEETFSPGDKVTIINIDGTTSSGVVADSNPGISNMTGLIPVKRSGETKAVLIAREKLLKENSRRKNV